MMNAEKLNPESVTAMYHALDAAHRPTLALDVLREVGALPPAEAKEVVTALAGAINNDLHAMATAGESKQARAPHASAYARCGAWLRESKASHKQLQKKEVPDAKPGKGEQMERGALTLAIRYAAAYQAWEATPTPENQSVVDSVLAQLRAVAVGGERYAAKIQAAQARTEGRAAA